MRIKKPLPRGAAENQNAEAVLGIGGLEHFLHHGQGGGGAGFQAAEPAHGQHEHIELESHFGHAVVNDAIIAAHRQAIGMAAAFLAAGAHDIIDLFVVVRHIELLAGEHAVLLVVPGALRKKAAAELKIAAVVMFQTDFFHIFLQN